VIYRQFGEEDALCQKAAGIATKSEHLWSNRTVSHGSRG